MQQSPFDQSPLCVPLSLDGPANIYLPNIFFSSSYESLYLPLKPQTPTFFSLGQNDASTSSCLAVFEVLHAYVRSAYIQNKFHFILLICLCHFNYLTSQFKNYGGEYFSFRILQKPGVHNHQNEGQSGVANIILSCVNFFLKDFLISILGCN